MAQITAKVMNTEICPPERGPVILRDDILKGFGLRVTPNAMSYNLGYDPAGQLTTAQAGSGAPPPPNAKQYYYNYDTASNRTGVQTSSTQTARIGGTPGPSDTVTITVFDAGLSGGQEAVTYTVQVGDTLAAIAAALAAGITADTKLQAIGVNATSVSAVITIRSVSTSITTYSASTSTHATESVTLGIYMNGTENAAVGGTKTTNDTVTITVFDAGLNGGQEPVTYTVQSSDTLATIASGLASAINADTKLQALGVTATSASTVVSIKSASVNATTYTQSTNSGATETITLSINMNVRETAAVGGTKTTGDILTITVLDAGLSGGQEAVSYTVQSTDTLTTIASGLAAAINADTKLQAIGVTSTSSSTLIGIQSNSINVTSYRQSTNSGATETIALVIMMNGTETAAIGGIAKPTDTVTISVYDAGLPGGQEAVTYTVQLTDTLATIATSLASAINADTRLQAIGVTATSVSTVVNIKSTSVNLTTYTQSTSGTGGATETVTLGISTGVVQASFNNVNELTGRSAGGATRFQGTTSKTVKSVTINGTPATLNWSESFTGNPVLNAGSNNVAVGAVDYGNNTKTNNYQLLMINGSRQIISVTHGRFICRSPVLLRA